MATANKASAACAKPMRLERIIPCARRLRRTVEEHLLVGFRDPHVQTLLGNRLESCPARRIADRSFELHAIRSQRIASPLQIGDFALLSHARDSPCYDARRHQDETNEH